MNRTYLKWTLAVLALTGFVLLVRREGRATPEAQWGTNLPEALHRAKTENKPILIDFVADWCGPCHMMTDEVFKKPTFQEQSGRWVLLKIDVDQQPDVAAKYGSNSLPTLVALNAEGKAVLGSKGYGGPAHTMNFVARAFQKATDPAGATSPLSN